MHIRVVALLAVVACKGDATPSKPPSPAPAPVPAPAPTPVPQVPRHAELAAAVDAIATGALAKQGVPGLSIAVVWHGDPLITKGYGSADTEHHVAVDADTVFRIGSITKQFTAAEILRLAAAGKLAVDDPVVKYLPDYPVKGRAITLRHLLTHTSGIKDYEHGAWLEAHMAEPRPVAELVASFAAEPFDFDLGTQWSYSNSGYFLLGQIIEGVSAKKYADEIEAMLAATGVTGVRYCPDEQSYAHAARGYDPGGAEAKPILMAYAFSAGAICATASGLVAWERALAHGKVVDAASWQAMTTPVTLADGSHYNYGFGLFEGALGDHKMIFHNGGINGFTAKLTYYPDDDLYVAVLINATAGDPDSIDDAIGRALLDVPAPPPLQDLPIDKAELTAVVGRYTIPAAGGTIVVEANTGKLYVHEDGTTDGVRLMRQPDGSYAASDGSSTLTLAFVRDPAGKKVTGVTLGQNGMTFPGTRLP